MNCACCQHPLKPWTRQRVLRRYEVDYFRCEACGYCCTEKPYWLEEAYANAITSSDVGLVHRNLKAASITSAVIRSGFDRRARFLDEGGGYGLFVRLMRDRGFDFWRSDPYCRNLFAVGFDAEPGERFPLLTIFEVFEHWVDPAAEIQRLRARAEAVLLSTELLPDNLADPAAWPYFGAEHGQHVSFYTAAALRALAAQQGWIATPGPRGFHLLTPSPVSAATRLALRPRGAALVDWVLGGWKQPASYLGTDAEAARKLGGEGNG